MEERSKGSKKKKMSKKVTKVYRPEDDEEAEESNNYSPQIPQKIVAEEFLPKEEEISESPVDEAFRQQERLFKPLKAKNASEPIDVFQRKMPLSLPVKLPTQKREAVKAIEKHAAFNLSRVLTEDNDISERLTPLPPITSTQNLNEIFQTKLQSHSMKAFKVSHIKVDEAILNVFLYCRIIF